jgi:hypothetical protein
MQLMETYYAVKAVIRYYGRLPAKLDGGNEYVVGTLSQEASDLSERLGKEPIHRRVANLVVGPDTLLHFTKRHGLFGGDVNHSSRSFRLSGAQFRAMQEILQKAWMGDEKALKTIETNVEARLMLRSERIEIITEDLWSFACVLFLRDFSAGKTGVCANPDCPTRFFLLRRKRQKFCEHKCAVLMNVRRFRDRQRKLQKNNRRAKSARGRK